MTPADAATRAALARAEEARQAATRAEEARKALEQQQNQGEQK